MKRIIIASIAIIFCFSLFAQPTGYHNVYQSYKGEEGIVSLHIPGFILKFAGMCAGLEGNERELVRSLKSVTVLTIEDSQLYPGVNFTEEMDISHMKDNYQVMMEVHDGDEDVIIAARENKGKITDLIVVVGGEENTLVHVRGRMESDLLEQLAKVSGVKELQITAKL